jgi:hypothetical protein
MPPENTRLARIVAPTVAMDRSTVSLVGTVVASAIGVNIVAADQYLSVVPPGRMFKREFERRGLPPRLLTHTLGIRARSRRRWCPGTGAAPTWRRRWGRRLGLFAVRLRQPPEPADNDPRGLAGRKARRTGYRAGAAGQILICAIEAPAATIDIAERSDCALSRVDRPSARPL